MISQDMRESVAETERVKELEIERIDPNPYQPRERFDEDHLKELAASIERNGVLQPIVVRRNGERYQIIIGERRLRAAKIAGKNSVPSIVRDVSKGDSLKYALMENLQREDLNPIEEARGYVALREEFGLSVKEVAEMLGRDRSTVANNIRLLKLPGPVIALVEEGKLSAGQARALLSMGSEEAQVEWANRAANEGITVRELEKTAPARRKATRRRRRKHISPQIHALEERLEMHLGTRVRIVPRKRGGVISVEYYSQEELERVLERLGVEIAF